MKRLLSTVVVVVASAIMLAAQQLVPGSYLIGTHGWTPTGQPDAFKYTVQMVNPYTGQVTPLNITIPNNEYASCFLINSSTEFFMGTKQATVGAPVQGNVYKVKLQTNGTWKADRFNKRGGTNGKGALGINVTSMVEDDKFIYVCGSGIFYRFATDAQVHRILKATKQAFVHSQFGAAFMTPGALGSGGAMVRIGTTLHVFTFDSQWITTALGTNQHWSISTNPLAPAPKQVGQNLPASNRWDPARGFASSSAVVDPRSGNIIVVSRWGELLWRTPAGVNVKRMQRPGLVSQTNRQDELCNGCAINTDTWELALCDYLGASIDVYRDNGPLPTVNGLVKPKRPTPGTFTIAGIAYWPSENPSVYHPVGNGCKESGGLGPWSYINSPPTPGNRAFALTLSTGAKTAALAIALKQAGPIPLSGAPGCFVHVNPIALAFVAPVKGTATLSVPLPVSARGFTAYLQWLVLDPKANAAGIAVSEARMIRP